MADEYKEQKTWNEQFADWCKNSGKNVIELSREIGIPDSTLYDYIHGNSANLNKVSAERRAILYKLTGLGCFNVGSGLETFSQKKEREESGLFIDDYIANAEHAFYLLSHSLEALRPYPNARQELAKRLHQPHVGRLTSYLEGIYTDNEKIIPMIPKLPSKRDK